MNRLPDEELERRRRQAEARQRYRGPRQKPYRPRNAGKLKKERRRKPPRNEVQKADRRSREVNVRFPTLEEKEIVRAAAARAGLSMSAWIVELVEDTLRFDQSVTADRIEVT